jgi:hypothetical protein
MGGGGGHRGELRWGVSAGGAKGTRQIGESYVCQGPHDSFTTILAQMASPGKQEGGGGGRGGMVGVEGGWVGGGGVCK